MASIPLGILRCISLSIVLVALLSLSGVKEIGSETSSGEEDLDFKYESEIEDVDDLLDNDGDDMTEIPAMEKEVDQEEQQEEKSEKKTTQVETFIFFPDFPNSELIAGEPVHVIACLRNKGSTDVIVEYIEASFRYPQDYSYFIQNFTTTKYNMLIEPTAEASFRYLFQSHESYGGRPFGLSINLWYKDSDSNQYNVSVFNETVSIKELEVTFDTEAFFLYVLLTACSILGMFAFNYFIKQNKMGKCTVKSTTPEVGTQLGKNDIDYDWLPRETTTEFQVSKPSPRRHRKVKRNAGTGEE